MHGAIKRLQKTISDLESPRDNSLDNSIVVWLSNAFAAVGTGDSGSSSTGETSVLSVCGVLEDSGLNIRRCGDPDEAVRYVRELQMDGQLRCFIVGGDEKVVCDVILYSSACCNPSVGGMWTFLCQKLSQWTVHKVRIWNGRCCCPHTMFGPFFLD